MQQRGRENGGEGDDLSSLSSLTSDDDSEHESDSESTESGAEETISEASDSEYESDSAIAESEEEDTTSESSTVADTNSEDIDTLPTDNIETTLSFGTQTILTAVCRQLLKFRGLGTSLWKRQTKAKARKRQAVGGRSTILREREL